MRNAYGSFIATLSHSPAILSGLCILVVDDSDMVRKMIRRMLENALERIELIEAVDGQDAVDLVKTNHHIAGIIMDNMMPRLNGIEAINELKALKFSGFIIGATGNTEHTDFHSAGVQIVLKKPFSRELLVSALCQSYVSRPTLAPDQGSSSSRPPAQIDIVVRNAEST
jgi:CheY-like chemotaxis protein